MPDAGRGERASPAAGQFQRAGPVRQGQAAARGSGGNRTRDEGRVGEEEGRSGEEEGNCFFFIQMLPDSIAFPSSRKCQHEGCLRIFVPQPEEEEEGNRRGDRGGVSILPPSFLSFPAELFVYFDLFCLGRDAETLAQWVRKRARGSASSQPPAGTSSTPLVVLSSPDSSPQPSPQGDSITHPLLTCVMHDALALTLLWM